eukprot:5950239-Prorocentrum_lima.AAC.1
MGITLARNNRAIAAMVTRSRQEHAATRKTRFRTNSAGASIVRHTWTARMVRAVLNVFRVT